MTNSLVALRGRDEIEIRLEQLVAARALVEADEQRPALGSIEPADDAERADGDALLRRVETHTVAHVKLRFGYVSEWEHAIS
jgi:hypothetical protein